MAESFRKIGIAVAALLLAALLSGCATNDYAVRGDLMKYQSQFLDSAGRNYEYGSTLFEFDEDQRKRGNTGSVAIVHLSGTGDDEHGTVSTSYIVFNLSEPGGKGDARVPPDSVKLVHADSEGRVIEAVDSKMEKVDCNSNGCRRLTYRVYYPLNLPALLSEKISFRIYTGTRIYNVEYDLPLELEPNRNWLDQIKLFNWF